MARYTSIYSSIWDNPRIQELMEAGETSTVLLYLYLLTNSSTNIIGFYQLPLQSVAANLCATSDDIFKMIKTLEKSKLIKYDEHTRNLLIIDFFAHNPYPKGEKQLKSMSNQLKLIPRSALDQVFVKEVGKYADNDAVYIVEAFPGNMVHMVEETIVNMDHA